MTPYASSLATRYGVYSVSPSQLERVQLTSTESTIRLARSAGRGELLHQALISMRVPCLELNRAFSAGAFLG